MPLPVLGDVEPALGAVVVLVELGGTVSVLLVRLHAERVSTVVNAKAREVK